MNKSERKYFNTAVKMDEALINLLEKKDFEYITVKELCAEAGVNRSTFYLHYETMIDLLEETLEYLNNKFNSYFETKEKDIKEKIDSKEAENLIFVTKEYLEPYLKFIKDYKYAFVATLVKPEIFASHNSYKMLSHKVFRPIMNIFNIPESEQTYVLVFYIKGILGIIMQWVKTGCKESEEFITDLIVKMIIKK